MVIYYLMNILIYTHSWFPKIDGVTIRYKNIIDYLKENHNVHLVTPDDGNRLSEYEGIKIKKINGLQLPEICRDDNPEVILPDLRNSFTLFNDLKNYCIENKIDVIHVSAPDLIIPIFHLISNHLKIPVMSIYHTDVLEYLKISNKSYFMKIIAWLVHLTSMYSLFDCFGTTSPLMAKKIQDYKFYLSKEPVWLLPPSINTELFKPSEKKYIDQWVDNTVKLLYIGRITKEKSIDRILEAMDESMSLIIIGYGGAVDNLTNIAKIRKLNVKFISTIEQSELSEWYSSCDIFVMPSSSETLGFVTLEAMSCGCLVSGYSAGGTLDLIKHKNNGLFFKNKKELTENINFFKNNNNKNNLILEIKNNAISFSSSKNINNSCDKLLYKYKELVKNKKQQNESWLYTIFIEIILKLIIFSNQIFNKLI